MPWFRRLVVGLLQLKAGFRPRSVHVKSVVDNVASEQYSKTCLCWPLLVPIQTAHLIQMSNLWETCGTMETKLCNHHSSEYTV